jgi:hypothetical protein
VERHGARDMRVCAPHADAERAHDHACMLRLPFNLLHVRKNYELAITTILQVLQPHTPAQTALCRYRIECPSQYQYQHRTLVLKVRARA